MYISQLVKTRDLHPGLLQSPSCFLSCSVPSLNIDLVFLFSYLFFFSLQNLLLPLPGGSAIMPSHIQGGPSVAIPSV
jgi:hypothetical protein